MKTRKPKPKRGHIKASHRQNPSSRNTFHAYFSKFAQVTSRAAGSPITFLIAVASIVCWAIAGPLFQFSDTWQLVVNTSTTIITFLMVFLIQNSQNRDSLAIQLKLSELIISTHGAKDGVAAIENLSDEDLEKLHGQMSGHVERMQKILETRRS